MWELRSHEGTSSRAYRIGSSIQFSVRQRELGTRAASPRVSARVRLWAPSPNSSRLFFSNISENGGVLPDQVFHRDLRPAQKQALTWFVFHRF